MKRLLLDLQTGLVYSEDFLLEAQLKLLAGTKNACRWPSGFALQVRAKAIRKYVDKMITLAKRGDLHARRQVSTLTF